MRIKTIIYSCIIILSSLSMGACQKEKVENDMPDSEFVPKEFPVGQIIGESTSATIGAGGGELSSIDGHVRLLIPAGALSEPKEINITTIENSNPGGIGTAFRISPHDITFAKEIQIEFAYSNELDQIASESFLGIAYQDADRMWHYLPSSVVDKQNKVVRVKTDHFSDWTLMQWMYLLPASAWVKTSGELLLEAVRVLPANVSVDGFLTPLVSPGAESIKLGDYVPLEQKFIKRWSLSGAGSLAASGNTAIYTAPTTLPNVNPVAVNVELNAGSQQGILVSHVGIMGGDIQLRVGNSEVINMEGFLLRTTIGEHILTSTNNGRLAIKWSGNGSYMTYNNSSTTFQYIPPTSRSLYTSTYNLIGEPTLISKGGVKINSNKNGVVSGTFTVSPAGHFASPSGNRIETAPISGKFRVRMISQ